MAKEVKAATSTVTELVNATEVASIEQSNTNNMEKKEISENGNAANAASNELKSWGKDMGIKPTTVKARINGEVQTIIVAHTEYGMRHDKKMDKTQKTANKEKLLTPRYHFCKPEIFWKEGYNLFDNNGELIEQGTTNVLTHCETPETSERIYIDDFLEEMSRDREVELEKMKEYLYVAIEDLPANPKKVLTAIVFNNTPYKVVAEEMGISVNTVKTYYARALQALRKSLDGKTFCLLFLSFFSSER